jgi:hypothetical protein
VTAPRASDGYERSDVEARPLLVLGLVTLCFLVGGLAVSAWVDDYLTARLGGRLEPDPLEDLRLRSDAPALLAVPARELAEQRAWEAELLDTAGWIDPVNGVVRIPIERALELTLEEGLPVRAPTEAEAGGGR